MHDDQFTATGPSHHTKKRNAVTLFFEARSDRQGSFNDTMLMILFSGQD